jgi:hypothetical protein
VKGEQKSSFESYGSDLGNSLTDFGHVEQANIDADQNINSC